jgi:hypothetical protein
VVLLAILQVALIEGGPFASTSTAGEIRILGTASG